MKTHHSLVADPKRVGVYLATRLASHPGKPLYLVNIAGGPSMDSVNAVLVLRKQNPALLQGRPVRLEIFDQDVLGPGFAARALDALRVPGAPLSRVEITLVHVPYRWDEPASLRDHLARLPKEIVAAVSSEGGLFDYGSDEEIVANLAILRDCLPPDTVVAGSVSRADTPGGNSRSLLRFATRPRELAAFEALMNRAGWLLDHSIIRPFSFNVRLSQRHKTAQGESAAAC
jgi:hypothetical protein